MTSKLKAEEMKLPLFSLHLVPLPCK